MLISMVNSMLIPNRLLLIACTAFLSLMLGPGVLSPGTLRAAPPNIVFILADDLGYTDLACYGSRYYETPNIHVDLYASLLEIGHAPKPTQVLDGQSLVPLMQHKGDFAREAIFQHFPGYLGAGADTWRTTPVSTICAGEWKLMEFLEDGQLELYNLDQDIGESKNLAQTNAAKTKELHDRLIAWRKEISASMPTRNDGQAPSKKKQKVDQ